MFKISFPFKNDDICKFVPNAIIAAGIIIAMRSDVIINETDEDIITRIFIGALENIDTVITFIIVKIRKTKNIITDDNKYIAITFNVQINKLLKSVHSGNSASGL